MTSTNEPTATLIDGHRSDIEGLRAVAVLAVLLYHAGVPGVSGGYVGVDVFFALSGYLMTALLVTERWRTGRIAFGSFYARRARRLLPASVTVLLATLVGSWFVLPPLAFERTATDIAAAGGYVVNLRFAREATDYLGSDVGASPVLHYWSLAVEEQFYLVWPVLLGLALGRAGRRRGPIILLAVVAVVSFVLSVAWTAQIQPWAFFSLPTRAWEFAVGGLVAFWMPAVGTRRSDVLGWGGIALVVAAVVGFDESTRFPGPSAAVPVVGTAMVLAAGGRGPARLLGAGVFQWIGRRSYGLYLWHWPPLVLLPVLLDRELTLLESLAILAGSFVTAAVALRLIEDPVRFARVFSATPWRSAVLAAGLTLSAVSVPLWARTAVDTTGTGVATDIGMEIIDPVGPTPVPADLLPSLLDVENDTPGDLYEVGCHADQLATAPRLPCEYGSVASDTTVVLFGDSHMAQWFPAFEAIADELDLRIVSLTKSGCPSAMKSVYNQQYERSYDECDEWREATLASVVDVDPALVVLGNYPGGEADTHARALTTTVDRFADAGLAVLVIGPTPIPPANVPDCVSGTLQDTRPCDLDRATRATPNRRDIERGLVEKAGARYLDPTDWFCGEAVCPAVLGRYLVYRDGSHVATPYMRRIGPNLHDAWIDLGLPVGSSAS